MLKLLYLCLMVYGCVVLVLLEAQRENGNSQYSFQEVNGVQVPAAVFNGREPSAWLNRRVIEL